MKAIIHYGTKRVKVGVADVVDAGWAGFDFAKNNPDLVEAGWRLWYFQSSDPVFTNNPGLLGLSVQGKALGDKIREGPPCTHSCPQHPEREAAG